MEGGIHIYMSDWGEFPMPNIPLEMVPVYREWKDDDGEVTGRWEQDVKPLPANQPFWQWLHVQEVAAGKPDVPRVADVAWRRLGEEEKKNLH